MSIILMVGSLPLKQDDLGRNQDGQPIKSYIGAYSNNEKSRLKICNSQRLDKKGIDKYENICYNTVIKAQTAT